MNKTPKELGYSFPAEFAKHEATWLSWPHKEASWPGKINTIFPYYSQFIKELAKSEVVRINVVDEKMKAFALEHIQNAGAAQPRPISYLKCGLTIAPPI